MQSLDSVLQAVGALSLTHQSTLWIAYSGGVDSTALLHACVDVHGVSRCKAVHVNHNIQPESGSWAEHCVRTCDGLGIELDVVSAELGSGNVELNARLERYRQFESRLQPGDLLATGHHAEDMAETRLWQLLTGRALVGIAEHRNLGLGTVVRPLLGISKHDLVAYARQNDLTWIDDPSNLDTSFDRNWIRHELLPSIERRFPGIRRRLVELDSPQLPRVETGPLNMESSPVHASVVRAWLLAHQVNPPGTVVEEVVRQSQSRADAEPVVRVSSTQTVRRYRERLHVVVDTNPFEPTDVEPGVETDLGNGVLSWRKCQRGYARNRTLHACNRTHSSLGKLTIRSNQMTKSVAKLFQEESVPPWLRDGWPILVESGRIVCVPGIADADGALRENGDDETHVPTWTPRET